MSTRVRRRQLGKIGDIMKLRFPLERMRTDALDEQTPAFWRHVWHSDSSNPHSSHSWKEMMDGVMVCEYCGAESGSGKSMQRCRGKKAIVSPCQP